MNNSSRWLWVVLIATLQLVLLLTAVVALFFWLSDSANRTLGEQACRDNFTMIHDLSDSISSFALRDIRRADSADRAQLRSLLSQFNISNAGRIDLFDFGTGDHLPVIETTGENRFEKLSDIRLQPLDSIGQSRHLNEAVSNKTNHRSAYGKVQLNGQIYFASAEYLPSLNAIVLVTQHRTRKKCCHSRFG